VDEKTSVIVSISGFVRSFAHYTWAILKVLHVRNS
jgi:hypothetical protein